MKTPDLTPAVLYLRMSSDDQTVSIDRQQQELARLEGFRIVRTYKDEGKSGSKEQDKRTDFQRLLLDATAKHDFKAVLCYNASRFARLDTIDGAFAKQILRQQGVVLHTVCEGRIDWNTVEGRMYDFMLSEQNHAYSRTLSKDSVSGRMRALEAGCWPYGCIPYGYDRLYVCGAEKMRVKRADPFRKPRNWQLYLVVNEEEAAVVKQIFSLFLEKAMSKRGIAKKLNGDGIPAPDNLPHAQKLGWTDVTVSGVLRHKAYIGVAEVGAGKKTAKEAFNRLPPTAKRDCCPILVEETLWNEAQRLLDRNKERKSRQQPSRSGMLSGVLTCGHCGYRLRKEQRGDGPVCYICDSPARRPGLGCRQWRVTEAELLPAIVGKVIEEVDADLLEALDSRPRPGQEVNRPAILEKHAESLKSKISAAARRCLTEEDDDLSATFREEVKRLEELHEAEAGLRLASAVENAGGVKSFAAWWGEQKQGLLLFGQKPPAECVSRGPNPPPFIQVKPDAEEPAEEPGADAITYYEGTACFDKDGFRALLSRLGVEAKVYWTQARHKIGNKRFEVDFARLTIAVTWEDEKTSQTHDVQGRNGTC